MRVRVAVGVAVAVNVIDGMRVAVALGGTAVSVLVGVLDALTVGVVVGVRVRLGAAVDVTEADAAGCGAASVALGVSEGSAVAVGGTCVGAAVCVRVEVMVAVAAVVGACVVGVNGVRVTTTVSVPVAPAADDPVSTSADRVCASSVNEANSVGSLVGCGVPCMPVMLRLSVSTRPKISASASTPTMISAVSSSPPMSRRPIQHPVTLQHAIGRNDQFEGTGHVFDAFEPDLAAVRFDQRARNRQSHTRITQPLN